MKLRLKVLLGILISLLLINNAWIVYDIRKEIQLNEELRQREIKINDKIILDIYKQLNTNNKIISIINENLEMLNKSNEKHLEIELLLAKGIDNVPNKINTKRIKLEQTLKQVNIMIVNFTQQIQGSGVYIKYKDKFYILTAGHLAKDNTDKIYLYENKIPVCKLEVVKHDFEGAPIETNKNDLLLLRPINQLIRPIFYTEIAENEPITGTQIYIVGNPMGIEDVLSDGRVIVYTNNFMYYIDHTYFGNSGGGVYNYDGKVIGIVSHIYNLKLNDDSPDYIINGAVRLSVIQKFLEGVE